MTFPLMISLMSMSAYSSMICLQSVGLGQFAYTSHAGAGDWAATQRVKGGNGAFNDTLNTFFIYGYMVFIDENFPDLFRIQDF